MKKILTLLIIVMACICLFPEKSEAFGLLYTNAVYPVTATGNITPDKLSKLKKGEASALNLLYLFEVGDAGINKAALDGKIDKIDFIDIREKTIFVFYRKLTTTVYGE
ncbi:MAG: TRL-like family protein [bacterium]